MFSSAVTFHLHWAANTDGVTTGYKVYYGPNLSQSKDVFNNISTTITFAAATQSGSFAVTAYDASSNESSPSNQLNYISPDGTSYFAPVNAVGFQFSNMFLHGAKY